MGITMSKQKGMAVVMALLLVALAATASSLVLWQQGLWWRRVESDAQRAKVRQVARAGLDWARDILRADAQNSQQDALSEIWAQPLPPTEADGLSFQGRLQDEQAKFNLTNLKRDSGGADPAQFALYRRLLSTAGLPESLAEQLLHWQGLPVPSANDASAPAAATDNGNRLIRFASLRQVPGYSPEVLAKLAPLATVLPNRSEINVNTAALPLLQALLPEVSPATLAVLAQQRVTSYFKDSADFQARLPAGTLLPKVPYTVASQYFLVQGTLAREHTRYRLNALLYRPPQALPNVLWQEEGAILDPAQQGEPS